MVSSVPILLQSIDNGKYLLYLSIDIGGYLLLLYALTNSNQSNGLVTNIKILLNAVVARGDLLEDRLAAVRGVGVRGQSVLCLTVMLCCIRARGQP